MSPRKHSDGRLGVLRFGILYFLCLAPHFTAAQSIGVLNENCTATIQNRTVQISPDGTFAIPNVPNDGGYFRVRVTCKNPDGTTSNGASEFLLLVSGGETRFQHFEPGSVSPAPVSIRLNATSTDLTAIGQTSQLTVVGTLPDGTTREMSTGAS